MKFVKYFLLCGIIGMGIGAYDVTAIMSPAQLALLQLAENIGKR